MRKVIMIAAGMALAASSIAVGASAYASGSAKGITVDIRGTNILKINRAISTTYRFPDTIKVHKGEWVTFVNKTVEAHTVTLVDAADLPTTVNGVFNCSLCNKVNGIYGTGNGPPHGVQIDNGKISDDSSHDADVTDPNVPAGAHLPFPVLVEDFDTAGHGNTVGDSTLVPSTTNHVGFSARSISVTAAPGTYHYYCTFHAWMQGTLIVTS